jgi:hypothetical protein
MAWLMILVDAVIILTLIEFLALWAWHRQTGRGVSPKDIGLNLFSGVALMLSLKFALAQASFALIAAALALAGMLHALDIVRRWRR